MFLLTVLSASIIAGSLCGISGVLIARLRLSTLVFAIAHAALFGAALGLFLDVDPLYTAMILAILSSVIIGPLSDATGVPSDTLAMVMFSTYNALTFIFIFLSPGPTLAAEKVGGILWGSVLAVTRTYLVVLLMLAYLYALVLALFWNRFQSILFDRRLAEAEGVNTRVYVYLLITLSGIAISVSLKIVGGFLVFSLLYIPAACGFVADSIKRMILLSALIGGASGSAGVVLSFIFNLPVGACIVATATVMFIAVSTYAYVRRRNLLSYLNLRIQSHP